MSGRREPTDGGLGLDTSASCNKDIRTSAIDSRGSFASAELERAAKNSYENNEQVRRVKNDK